ncbi:MAG TPA: cupin domain-containing protein [Clostridia bacterium]|nr:cupin domain-containing protein [Clostridia bacterium]
MDYILKTEDVKWVKHPKFEGVSYKPFLTKKEHNSDITCMLVKTPKGVVIPEHIHEGIEDIIYPIKGKGKIFIEGKGTFSMEPGVWIRVPKDTPHYVFDVEETLIVYDVFNPASM